MAFRYPPSALTLVLLVAVMRPALAESPGGIDKNAARDRFKQGAEAYSQGRYKDAIDLFRDADRLAPNPAFAYNIGLAYEELEDAANALRWYRSYLRDLPGAPDQAEVEPRIVAAEAHLRDRGVQQVTIISSPSGATVSIDGRRVGVAPWTSELPPGTHQLGLELHGFADGSVSFELPADHAIDVGVLLAPVPDVTTVSIVPPPTPTSGPHDAGVPWQARVRPVTWATLGVGVAGLGAALGFELVRKGAADDARHSPTNLVGKEAYDRAKVYETAAKIAVGAGSAVTALSGVLLYFDLSTPSHRGTTVGTAVGCSGALCGVSLDGTF